MKPSSRVDKQSRRGPKPGHSSRRGGAAPGGTSSARPPVRQGSGVRALFTGKVLPFLFLMLVTLLGVVSLVGIYSNRLAFPPLRSDGMVHYLYLPEILIRHDPSLHLLIQNQFRGECPTWIGILPWQATGRFLIKYPMGTAVLMTPFFILAALLALLTGARLDGYSWPFQYVVAASGLCYALAGLWILWKLLARRFQPATVLVTMTGLIFATNLFHYATYDGTFSHAFSFFLFSLFLVLTERLYSRGRMRDFALAGACAGLIALTRLPNACWLVFGLGYGVYSRQALKDRLSFWKGHVLRLALASAVAFLVFLPQLLYWKIITGSFLVFSYQGEGFNFAHPQLFNVLFSVRKGLFFWSPFLLVALAGLVFLRRKAPEWLLPILIYLPIHLYVVASWHEWAYGCSFGHRAFTEALPLFALCFAALYEGIEHRRWRNGLALATLAFGLISSWLMSQYWTKAIPMDNATWGHILRAFGYS